ncbi:MAG: DUF4157 domain-containing protein [Bacteroidota bacterium]
MGKHKGTTIHDSRSVAQRREQNAIPESEETPTQQKKNNTGLPDNLKSGIENLSGYAMDDVNVHYNSSQPAGLNAHAYAQGTDIHIAPGQEKHLPHEAWHVVQQKQGRVKPTRQMKGKVNVNDDEDLEKEADVMGEKAIQAHTSHASPIQKKEPSSPVVQRMTGYEIETNIPVFGKYNDVSSELTPLGQNGFTETIGWFLTGGLKYGLNYGEDPEGRYNISADHNELMDIHKRMIHKFVVLGLLKEGFTHRSLANIEYITPPRPEVSPGSVATNQEDIAAVKGHIDQTLPVAASKKVGMVPAPGQDLLTGFPQTELLNWLKSNGIEPGLIFAEIAALHKTINRNVYLQETSGVLPEDIPEVYKEAAGAMKEAKESNKTGHLMAAVMEASTKIGEVAFGDADRQAEFGAHKNAVVGYLTLLANYLLANNISSLLIFRGSTAKNLVPFMSKTALSGALQALPASVRPTGAGTDPWNSMAKILTEEAKKYPVDYWAGEFDLKIDPDKDKNAGTVFPEGNEEALKKLIQNEELQGVQTGNQLTLDDPHSEVEAATGQKAIPLEDRYFKYKQDEPLTSENMQEAIGRRFGFSVGLNLKHVPEAEKKREILGAETSAKITPEQQEQTTLNRITARISDLKKLHSILFKATIVKEDEATLIGPFEKSLSELGAKTGSDKDIAMGKLDQEVYTSLGLLNQMRNHILNKDRSEDTAKTFESSAEEMFSPLSKGLDLEFGQPLLDFKKKELKAEDLKEAEDQKQMNEVHLKNVNKVVALYDLLKGKILKMNAGTDVKERIKNMNKIRKSILLLKQRITEAEEFYASKPKVKE